MIPRLTSRVTPRRPLRTSAASLSSLSSPHLSIKSILSNSSSQSENESFGTSATLQGWIRSCRRQKNISFAVINDGSNVDGIQAVLGKGLDAGITIGCSARLEGSLVPSKGKGQAKEFRVDSVTILGESDAERYPIANTKQALPAPFLRKNAHLRPRTKATGAMLRVRSEMNWAAHAYFREEGFVQIQTPLITSSDCEGAGETFRVESGSPPAPNPSASMSTAPIPIPLYLTVSSQLHLEAIASSLPKVYTLSPAFRAEKSDTARHLQEFWMLEAEIAFLPESTAEGLEKVMNVAEGVTRRCISNALEVTEEEIRYFDETTLGLRDSLAEIVGVERAFPRLEYTDAIVELQRHEMAHPDMFRYKPIWGGSLQTEHEKWIAEELIGGPVFVMNYPAAIKPFYMLPSAPASTTICTGQSQDRTTAACFDLLIPRLGELAGGSLREHRLDELVSAMDRHGLDRKDYEWYLDLRRFGSTRHGGFGLGWERLIAFVTGLNNVRDCITFPRASEGSQF